MKKFFWVVFVVVFVVGMALMMLNAVLLMRQYPWY